MTILGNMWKQEDPRSNLEKASRYDLAQLAKRLGFSDITYDTPQPLQVKMLRARGVTDIDVPIHVLGDIRPTVYGLEKVQQQAPAPTQAESKPMMADELLEMQYQKEIAKEIAKSVEKPVEQMTIIELRSACKARGIKMARTDNMDTLRAKVRGENAA